MKAIILVSCSDHKRSHGKPYVTEINPLPWLENSSLKARLFSARREVLTLIKTGKLEDYKKGQGLRKDDPRNASLKEGPDFGGLNQDGLYLPAYRRYEGRFFRELIPNIPDESAKFLWEKGFNDTCVTLIVSGLYGFVSPFDLLQEYTCHFPDRTSDSGKSLLQIWRPVLTDIITDISSKFRANRIIDLLSEQVYQDVIDWKKIYSKKIKCFHRVFKKRAGPETLINLARFYLNEFLLASEPSFDYPYDEFIQREYFDRPDERILFESEYLGTKAEVRREGIPTYIIELMELYRNKWRALDNDIQMSILNSEYNYQENSGLANYDFASASISLSKAIEKWIRRNFVETTWEFPKRSLEWTKAENRFSLATITLGGMAKYLKIRAEELRFPIDFKGLADDLRNIAKEYRNGWVHDRIMSEKTYVGFRAYTPDFFGKWLPQAKVLTNWVRANQKKYLK